MEEPSTEDNPYKGRLFCVKPVFVQSVDLSTRLEETVLRATAEGYEGQPLQLLRPMREADGSMSREELVDNLNIKAPLVYQDKEIVQATVMRRSVIDGDRLLEKKSVIYNTDDMLKMGDTMAAFHDKWTGAERGNPIVAGTIKECVDEFLIHAKVSGEKGKWKCTEKNNV